MLQSSSSENKLVKSLKNCFFGPNLHKNVFIMVHVQSGKQIFFSEITNTDHQLSETFYFIKISCLLSTKQNKNYFVSRLNDTKTNDTKTNAKMYSSILEIFTMVKKCQSFLFS